MMLAVISKNSNSASNIIEIVLSYWIEDFNHNAETDYANRLTDEQFRISAVAKRLLTALRRHQNKKLTDQDYRVIFHCLGRFSWAIRQSVRDNFNSEDTCLYMARSVIDCAVSIIIALNRQPSLKARQRFVKTIKDSQFDTRQKKELLKILNTNNKHKR